MPNESAASLLCYNKGCGKEFAAIDNNDDSCTYHPGIPFFHDAYKGWTCCNKKCTDFTEFLNFKGCTTGSHSNVKPPEAEKPAVEKMADDEVIECKAPIPVAMPRPAYSTPLVALKTVVSPSLELQALSLVSSAVKDPAASDVVPAGTSCKNAGCKATYGCEESCTFHPGYPVFHEGLKFWTCCQKRTSDFDAFLAQVGCTVGCHTWFRDRLEPISCRHDWHQTGAHVVVSIFAKKYDPRRSSVQLSPVRLFVNLHFPEEEQDFVLDEELRGVVDVSQCTAHMFQTKVEVKLKKAEAGSWSNLGFPRVKKAVQAVDKALEKAVEPVDDEPVDLGDL